MATDLAPALPPPLPEDELREIEREAAQLIEDYNQFKAQYDTNSWRTEGHEASSRKLEAIDKWFARRCGISGMLQRRSFKTSSDTLLRYRTELGLVEAGTLVTEGVLEERIGEGGFGTVWKVLDPKTDTRVALKLYHPHEMNDDEKTRRFETGYDAMRMLKHHQIISVHRYSRCPTGFVMNYIDGPNLRALEPNVFMEPVSLVRLLIDIADPILHAHNHEVIHRDIKPENIVCEFRADGTVCPHLTDFDLAWFNTKTQRVTKSAMGVVYYAAPEQYFAFDPKAALTKTPALDVFSFGQLMYFCFTGRDPDPVHLARNAEGLVRAAMFKGFDNLSVNALQDLYSRATMWEYKDRLQDFAIVLRDLRAIETSLLHTSATKPLGRNEFIAEVISRVTGTSTSPGTDSCVSAAGTWQVNFEFQDKRKGRSYVPKLVIHFVPQNRIGFENVKNDQMRRALNRRLDDALRNHSGTTRKSGTHGTYEVFVEVFPCPLTPIGATTVTSIVTESIGALSM